MKPQFEILPVSQPQLLKREAGDPWTIKVYDSSSGQVDLTGSVLHQLTWPRQIPQFLIQGHKLVIPSLDNFFFNRRMLYSPTMEPVGEFVSIPPVLREVDSLLGGLLNGNPKTEYRKSALLKELSSQIDNNILHCQTFLPGIRGYIMGAPPQVLPGEVAITEKMAYIFIKELIKYSPSNEMYSKMLHNLGGGTNLGKQFISLVLGGEWDFQDKKSKAILSKLSEQLDGMSVFAIRYPNASEKSGSRRVLRVLKNVPGNPIMFPVEDLVNDFQGDADGDSGFIALLFEDRKQVSKPRVYNRDFSKMSSSLDLRELEAPEAKSGMEIMKAFSQRGLYIGLLTKYCIWILGYTASIFHKELGFKKAEDVWPKILSLATPLIEGVMNSRKMSSDTHQIDGEALANIIIYALRGRYNYEEAIAMLPVLEEGEIDEEKFSSEQITFLRKIFRLSAQQSDRINLSEVISDKSPVLWGFNENFNKSLPKVLANCPNGQSLYKFIQENLFCQRQSPWITEKPVKE